LTETHKTSVLNENYDPDKIVFHETELKVEKKQQQQQQQEQDCFGIHAVENAIVYVREARDLISRENRALAISLAVLNASKTERE
jgi:hypothetical protein